MLSKENTLDWIRTFYAKMAEGDPTQRGAGTGSISPPVMRQAAPTLEGTLGVIAEMQNHHAREMSGVVDTIAQMKLDFRAQIEQLTQQGRRYDQQYAPAHVAVKLVGDVHRTLRNICRAPELSQANLADFDQWAEEMIHTIDAARTNMSSSMDPSNSTCTVRWRDTSLKK